MILKIIFVTIVWTQLIAIVAVFGEINFCGANNNPDWFKDFLKLENVCAVDFQTQISSRGFKVEGSPDSSARGLNFQGNKMIEYLPLVIFEAYPELMIYDGGSCAIKSIERANFLNLKQMKYLWLGFNQIQIILSDTFIDMPQLTYLGLDENKITFMNYQTIEALPKLSHVWLEKNVCISQNNFGNETSFEMLAKLRKSCSYDEFFTAKGGPPVGRSIQNSSDVMCQIQKAREIAVVQTKLESAERARERAEVNLKAIIETKTGLCEEIDSQRNQTFEAATKAMREEMQLKTIENVELLIEIQMLKEDLEAKKNQISALKRTIDRVSQD
jgi:Leucine rich repeat